MYILLVTELPQFSIATMITTTAITITTTTSTSYTIWNQADITPSQHGILGFIVFEGAVRIKQRMIIRCIHCFCWFCSLDILKWFNISWDGQLAVSLLYLPCTFILFRWYTTVTATVAISVTVLSLCSHVSVCVCVCLCYCGYWSHCRNGCAEL